MIAGSTTDQAGGFTSFSLLLTRPDDQQRIGTLQFKTPEGLLGMISKVPLCPEAASERWDVFERVADRAYGRGGRSWPVPVGGAATGTASGADLSDGWL